MPGFNDRLDYLEDMEARERHVKRIREIEKQVASTVLDFSVMELNRQLKTARATSLDMAPYQPDAKAWVYIFVHPESKPRYGVRFTIAPECASSRMCERSSR
jgi:hypothetical protein